MNIINFVQLTENIGSSGQPSREEFTQITTLGYKTVINLALVTSDNAIVNEGDIVTELGLPYIHIPIQWQQPLLEQFRLFVAVMQQQNQRKVWVHCAFNMRVSVFLYLYSRLHLKVDESVARQKLNQVWEPNDIWSQFIIDVINSYKN